ncbi:hypothetical protein LF875_13610, partial [Enterococcus faecalis]|nr:hypothetical protein [Enterococcus faecalis]MCA6731206.1 hypothetical protein [Enterococcus faecalis]
IEEVRLACFAYIEGFYNTKRPHGTLDMLTPTEKEALYFENLYSLFMSTLLTSIQNLKPLKIVFS